MTSPFAPRRPFVLAAAFAATALAGSITTSARACDNDTPTTASATAPCTAPIMCCSRSATTAASTVKTARAVKPARSKKSHTAKATAPNPAAPATTTFMASGLTITIDPETGRIVKPTADQLRALGLAAQPAPGTEIQRPPLELRRLPDGGTLLMMDDRFANYATVRMGADGTLYYDCERDPSLGAPALASPATPSSPPAATAAPRHETR